MPIDYALAKRLHTKHKAALTRAKNTGDPRKVIAACDAYFDAFEAADLPLTDDWHNWNIAKSDAELAIAYAIPYRG
jgi:hypothetical protein